MSTTPKAIQYLKSGALTMTVFTGDDTTVDTCWTNLTSATPGLLTDGTSVTYAQLWNPAVLNAAKTAVIGGFWPNTGGTTYGAPPVNPPAIIEPIISLALANGANNNISGLGNFNAVRVIGPTAAFSITGFAASANGAILTIWNTTVYPMTIANQSGSSLAANRITTGTGANIIVPGKGSIQIIYSSGDSAWLTVVPSSANATPIPAVISAASGAIAIPGTTNGQVVISYAAGNGAYTILAPTTGGPGVGNDGQILLITSLTARSHVITCASDGFNAKGSSGTVTLSGDIGDNALLLAYGGHWYVLNNFNSVA